MPPSRRPPIASWMRRLWAPLRQALKQGLSPGALAAALAVGLALGVFPLVGTTTLLSAGVAAALGLNQAVVQLANYLAYPLQLALLVPFIRLGERVFGVPHAPLALGTLLDGLRSDFLPTLGAFGTSLGHACVAWALVVPATAGLLALLLRPLLGRLVRPGTGRT